ncbi:MAG: DNA-binding protein, partial [Nitrospirae bacterium CG01_land_8_20_14_3_00_44_22]
TLADVKAGDKVTAKYTTADGKNTAKSVIKKTAAAKKAAPAKKAPAAGY